MVRGECNCGAVRFEVRAALSDVFMCHCSICRRSTGSGGIAVGLSKISDFRWLTGEELIRYWKKPGHDWHTNFCSVCGTSLPGINDDAHMYIPVGCLVEGAEELRVAHHLWVGSKASWERIAEDDGKSHIEAYGTEK